MSKCKSNFFIVIFSLFFCISVALADTQIELMNSKNSEISSLTTSQLMQLIKQNIDINQYRLVKFQVMHNEQQQIDHLVVYLFSKKYHRVDFVRINLDAKLNVSSVQNHYQLTAADDAAQPGINALAAKCPNPSIEFIAFAPNKEVLEQAITIKVANAARKHSLKTVQLLLKDATRENYLNYMTCPHLKGNFYDGDASPDAITTVDGVISHHDIEVVLKHAFRFKVTNIWLACEAYNDPMKTAVINIAETQKYAAGIDDLLVGPSDKAAACTMINAMDGFPMKAVFNICYKLYDKPQDVWGFGGYGSNIFGW